MEGGLEVLEMVGRKTMDVLKVCEDFILYMLPPLKSDRLLYISHVKN